MLCYISWFRFACNADYRPTLVSVNTGLRLILNCTESVLRSRVPNVGLALESGRALYGAGSYDHPAGETVCCHGRLWAEIFEVREENGRMFWGRVSDDLVPVNVVCVQDTPSTVYQITAYNSLVKKIFDIRLVQPGYLLLHS